MLPYRRLIKAVRFKAVFYSVVVWSLISPRDVRLPFIQECLSASASCRKSPRRWFSVWFTTADWWCRPKREGKWKMCLGFSFFFLPRPSGGRETKTHRQTNTLSSLCMSYKRSLTRNNPENTHTHTHTQVICLLLWIRHTHTHTHLHVLCCSLNGWTERRASFAKVSVLDRLRRGDEWLMEAQQGCRGNN